MTSPAPRPVRSRQTTPSVTSVTAIPSGDQPGETAAGAGVSLTKSSRSGAYDVAIPYQRPATGLIWFVAKLLREIGLEPVHEFTASSAGELARISRCRLVIGFTPKLDVSLDYMPQSSAQLLRRWFGIPLVWTCFNGPTTTEASLRAIAAHFGTRIERRTEMVIAANREKRDTIIARYRPTLEHKLMVHFQGEPDSYLECYRLLGLRVGNRNGWPGKTGVWRRPRLVYDPNDTSDKALKSYLAEAKPDFILCDRHDAFEARKFGQETLLFSPFFDQHGNTAWGYDGFAFLAAELDRAVNAPWRKLVKPPWPMESG